MTWWIFKIVDIKNHFSQVSVSALTFSYASLFVVIHIVSNVWRIIIYTGEQLSKNSHGITELLLAPDLLKLLTVDWPLGVWRRDGIGTKHTGGLAAGGEAAILTMPSVPGDWDTQAVEKPEMAIDWARHFESWLASWSLVTKYSDEKYQQATAGGNIIFIVSLHDSVSKVTRSLWQRVPGVIQQYLT